MVILQVIILMLTFLKNGQSTENEKQYYSNQPGNIQGVFHNMFHTETDHNTIIVSNLTIKTTSTGTFNKKRGTYPQPFDESPLYLNEWFQSKIINPSPSTLQKSLQIGFGLVAITPTPLFIALGVYGVNKVWNNLGAKITLGGICNGIATGSQFLYPGQLFGTVMGGDWGRSPPKIMLRVGKHTLEFVMATFANIPLLYLNHVQFAPYLGRVIYPLDVLCLLGGNFVWMWAIDYYAAQFTRHVFCCYSNDFTEILKNSKNFTHELETLDEHDPADTVFIKTYFNMIFTPLTEAEGLVNYLRNNGKPASINVSKIIGGMIGWTIGITGSLVYYNLGVDTTNDFLNQTGSTNVAVNFWIPQISGVLGVLTAATFNSIAGYKVVGDWANKTVNFIKDPFGCYRGIKTINPLKTAGSVLKDTSVISLAVGGSLPQLYLTFKNISQATKLSTTLDILSFSSGVLANYWPMRELVEDISKKSKKYCRGKAILTMREMKESLLMVSKRFEEQLYWLNEVQIHGLNNLKKKSPFEDTD